jgi:hypothetical protein
MAAAGHAAHHVIDQSTDRPDPTGFVAPPRADAASFTVLASRLGSSLW